MRPRVVMLACLAAIVLGGILVVPSARGKLADLGAHTRAAVASVASPKPAVAQMVAQAAPPEPKLKPPANPAEITAPAHTTFFGWAFLDRSSGAVTGSANSKTGTNTTESMIKPWIASDYLRTQAARGVTPSAAVLNELTLMIIDSNDDMAQKYYELDGGDAAVKRLISMCGLTNTTVFSYWWSKTQMSPQDAVRYGKCVADGTAAGPQWTKWILTTMQHVRGGVKDQVSTTIEGGHWGVIDGLPANLKATTSIKNGWTFYGDGSKWHINCLAINPAWVLNVEMRINTLQNGANACAAVAKQLTYAPAI